MPDTLIDQFGRVHHDLRISVTDRCNIRCFYCMPLENIQFLPRNELLTFEEIERFAMIAANNGIRKLRITGGEPLVRRDLPSLIERLVKIPGIEDVALTTNGIQLSEQAQALKDAGLHRLNISLDALNATKFEQITRRKGFDQVLKGIFTAQEIGFDKIKLNAVAIREFTEDEIVPFGEFARAHGIEVRFIEYMPLDAENSWEQQQVFPGEEIRQILNQQIMELKPLPVKDPSQPATDFEFADGIGRIGFINPVSQPFCSDCNRLRITAEGKLRNCLFSTEEWDARELLRNGSNDHTIADLVIDCIHHKKPGHGINDEGFLKPKRAMYQIGG